MKLSIEAHGPTQALPSTLSAPPPLAQKECGRCGCCFSADRWACLPLVDRLLGFELRYCPQPCGAPMWMPADRLGIASS